MRPRYVFIVHSVVTVSYSVLYSTARCVFSFCVYFIVENDDKSKMCISAVTLQF